MSGGILRFPWTSQPQTIEPLNSAIGINDWTCLHVFGKPIRGTAGTVGTLINTARYAPGQGGIALDIVAAGDYLSYSGTGLALGVQSGVMLVEVTSLANVTTFFCTSITGGGNGFSVLMNGSGFCNLAKHNVADFLTSSVKMRLGLNAIAWSYNNSTGRAKLAVNGVVTSATSTQTFSHNGSGLGRYRASDTVNSYPHKQYLFAQSPSEIFSDGLLTDLTKLPQSVWQLFQPLQRTIWVPAAGGSSTSLVIQDATHAHTADSLVLTSSTALTIADALHAHTADNLVLTSATALTIADATHAHTADNLTLTTTGSTSLTVADATHAHAADNLVLTSATALTIADATHAHAADNITLAPSGSTSLAVADATHAHAADNLVLTSAHALVIADAAHAHAADNLTLTASGAPTLSIEDALHAHSADSIVLTSSHLLSIADALHVHRADSITLNTGEADTFTGPSRTRIGDRVQYADPLAFTSRTPKARIGSPAL